MPKQASMYPRKSVRLMLLWLKRQINPTYRHSDYVRDTGLDKSQASHEMKVDLPELDKLLASDFPTLRSALSMLFRPEWVNGVVAQTNLGDYSTATISLHIDHKTGEVRWSSFDQQVYEGSDLRGTINVSAGKSTIPVCK